MKKSVRDELYKNGLYKNQIIDLMLWHFDDHKQAAEYFGVHHSTVKNWQKNHSWPLSVVRLLLIKHRGYLPTNKAWRGFKIRGDVLFTPAGRQLSAYDLQELDIRMEIGENVIEFRRKKKRFVTSKRKQNRALIRPK